MTRWLKGLAYRPQHKKPSRRRDRDSCEPRSQQDAATSKQTWWAARTPASASATRRQLMPTAIGALFAARRGRATGKPRRYVTNRIDYRAGLSIRFDPLKGAWV